MSLFNHLNFKSPSFAIALLGLSLSSQASASALDFTVNPTSVGFSQTFTADTFTVSEVSHIQFTDTFGSFYEAGYGFVTGALDNGVSVSTPGLNTDYSIYFQFTDTGSAGILTGGTLDLYVVQGKSDFSIDGGNNAQVDNHGNTPTSLVSATFTGTIGQTPTTLFADITSSHFSFTASGAAFFGLPAPEYQISGHFFHDVLLGGVSFEPGFSGVVIDHNGYDTISFAVVPENDQWLMMLVGLPMLTWTMRRKMAA